MSRVTLVITLAIAGLALISPTHAQQASLKTENVILMMTDGLRWQEVFRGAEESLITKEKGYVDNLELTRSRYWRDTPEARREALLPFIWNVVAKQGQLIGNRDKNSAATLTNGRNFSYPGYSEILCGFADDRIDSNEKIPNPNVTVFEWLNGKPGMDGRVAAFGAWDVFPSIFNVDRCGFYVNAGFDPMEHGTISPTMGLLNRLKAGTLRYWEHEPFDSLTFETALEYFTTHQPRLFFLCLGETDEWGHAGRYDHYLQSARNFDSYLRRLWETVQAIPAYRDKTTLILATDHGRGDPPDNWRSHSARVPHSDYVWFGFLGPDTPAQGEWANTEPVTQSQIAATIAELLGHDYNAAAPNSGKPISPAISGASR
jgi:hypothetical protein